MARRYEPIWTKLKLDGECVIVANPVLHKRIKKAVCKEKYNDATYKMEWELKGGAPELETHYSKERPNELRFVLVKPIVLGDL